MAVSDKTRKILWGRSGNRCAMCRRELVADATAADDESVVGDECHIVSPRERGPRYDPSFPRERLDLASNLILLCRVHHKMVDDQPETYTADVLSAVKGNHETWVSLSLTEDEVPNPVRIRRIESNVPSHLERLQSGEDLLAVVAEACAFEFSHDDLDSEAEVDLVGTFLQEAQRRSVWWYGSRRASQGDLQIVSSARRP